MKLYRAFLYSLLAISFASCDNIAEEDRLEGPIKFETTKNVLIEDFTGQICVNCPYAADAIHELQTTYGSDHVIAVGIHGGPLSISEDITAPINGLATTDGNNYVEKWGVESFPKGLVDRVDGLKDYTSWSAGVVTRLQATTPVSITVENSYDSETKKASIHVALNSEVDYSGNLQLWIIEDNIKGMQIIPPSGSRDMAYIHNHVYRASVNGTDGEKVTIGTSDPTVLDYTIDVKEKWVVGNLSVVAFVYDGSGVQQTVSHKVLDTNE